MTIIEALRDRQLFGGLPTFHDLTTWKRWLVFLKCVYGLPLVTVEEQAIYQHHTNRRSYNPPPGGWSEVVACVGRQSGKTRIAGVIVGYEAALRLHRTHDGTDEYGILVGQDHRGAMRALLSYAKAPFDRLELLKQQVRGRKADSLELRTGCTIAAYPCRPAAVRGLRARVVALDELAFYTSTEGYPVDVEMLRACRPMLAMTGGGKLIILSSPYGQTGALYDLYKENFGRDEAPVLVWRGSAPEMNPCLPLNYLERMRQDDPDAYRSEVLGEFRAGLTTFLEPDALAACVEEGVRERPPQTGVKYRAFGDPSGGRRDAFVVAISHNDGGRAVLDAIRVWQPPFNPEGVLAESSDFVRSYGIAEIVTDRYGAEFVAEGYRRHGIHHMTADKDASGIYLEVLPLINAKRCSLLDDPELLRELRGLERRRSSTGRDRVSHRSGEHDDRAVAAAGALVYASTLKRSAAVACIKTDTSWQAQRRGHTQPTDLAAQIGAGANVGATLHIARWQR